MIDEALTTLICWWIGLMTGLTFLHLNLNMLHASPWLHGLASVVYISWFYFEQIRYERNLAALLEPKMR